MSPVGNRQQAMDNSHIVNNADNINDIDDIIDNHNDANIHSGC